MRVDHVSYAAGSDGAEATAARLAEQLGVQAVDGGYHPGFGTRNFTIPLTSDRYIEVVEALEHPASYAQPFGQVVRARSLAGGGWLGWVLRVDDMDPIERQLGRPPADGHRTRPDGVELFWKQLGVKGLQADPQVPFFIQWREGTPHPSQDGPTDVTLVSILIAGDPQRVMDWIGIGPDYPHTVQFDFVAPHGTPGLLSVTFDTPRGRIVI